MAQNENISLGGPSPLNVDESHSSGPNAFQLDQADLRQPESDIKRACVLVGSAVLQLSIGVG